MESLALDQAPFTRIASVGSFFTGLREKSPPFSIGEGSTGAFEAAEVADGWIGSFDEGKGAVVALLLLLMMLMLFVRGVDAVTAICFWGFSLAAEATAGDAFVAEG